MIPNLAQKRVVFSKSPASNSNNPGVLAIIALATLTRSRRSWRRRSSARSSASLESSGRPLAVSRRLTLRPLYPSSSSSGTGNRTRDSNRVREKSWTTEVGTREAVRPLGPSLVGPVGLVGCGLGGGSKLPKHRTSSPSSSRSWRIASGRGVPCHRCPSGSHRRPRSRSIARFW